MKSLATSRLESNQRMIKLRPTQRLRFTPSWIGWGFGGSGRFAL